MNIKQIYYSKSTGIYVIEFDNDDQSILYPDGRVEFSKADSFELAIGANDFEHARLTTSNFKGIFKK